jgi:AbiTii
MLIDEIIGILGHENGSLTSALMKTKILLHNLGHKELVEWVNSELNGYSNKETIPPYRIIPSQVLANMSNGVWQLNSHPIPIGHLNPELKEGLENCKMGEALAELEAFLASGSQGNSLQRSIPVEAYRVLEERLGSSLRIQLAWCSISIHRLTSILVNVRSRLLDFLLELREQIGEGATDSDVKEKSDSVDTRGIFTHAIFGSNTTIIVGNQNTQAVSFNSEKIADLQDFLWQLKNKWLNMDSREFRQIPLRRPISSALGH